MRKACARAEKSHGIMEAPAASLANFLGAGRILIGNKSTPIGTLGVESEPSVKLLQFASVEKNKFYDVPGVLGHYFLFGQAPLISTGAPMRVRCGQTSRRRATQ